MINLRRLEISNQKVADVQPLRSLNRLTKLSLNYNEIDDLAPLADLTQIESLSLDVNLIRDLSSLADLMVLEELYLGGNRIEDISTLADLSNLMQLDVRINPLSDESLDTHLPALEARGVFVWPLDDEHGDTPKVATPLAFGDTLRGRISPSYDKDYFRLDVQTVFSVDIYTQGDLHSMGRLLDIAGDELQRDNEEGRNSNFLIRRKLLPGTYYVEVSAGNAAARYRDIIDEEGDYEIRAVVEGVDVRIPDENLRRVVERALDKSMGQPISSAEMATLKNLYAVRKGIADLTGLEFAIGLTSLSLGENEISDLSPLAGLTNLTRLSLGHNRITDVSPLENLINLKSLELEHNDITDLSPLAGLANLTRLCLQVNSIHDVTPLSGLTDLQDLDLGGNDIEDISPLVKLTGLTELNVQSNPLGDDSINVHLPTLEEEGIRVTALDDHGDTRGRATRLAFDVTVRGKIDPAYDEDYFRLDVPRALDVDVFTTGSSEATGRLLDADGTELERANEDGSDKNFLIRRHLDPGVYYVVVSDTRPGGFYAVTAVIDSVDVEIPDANLRSVLERDLHKTRGQAITSGELATLMTLSASQRNISDLSGLEFAVRLTKLGLDGNEIIDLSALSGLTNLIRLDLEHNQIADLSPLAGLAKLTWLSLGNNRISDLVPLASLTDLQQLSLERNEIQDLSPLASLTNLMNLDLGSNRIVSTTPLKDLTNLTSLVLSDNDIVDVSPLANLKSLGGLVLGGNDIEDISSLVVLTDLVSLDLRNNPLSGRSIDIHIPALEAEGVEVTFEDDHGNTPGTATVLALGETVYGEIEPHFDTDYFRLDLSGPADVQVFTEITPGNVGRIAGRLLDGSGAELDRNNDLGGSYNFVIERRLAPGTYFIEVRAIQDGAGGYSFSAAERLDSKIPDSRLRAAIKRGLNKRSDQGLNSIEIKRLEQLTAFRANISSLKGLELATGLTRLMLSGNSIKDVSVLAGLTKLTVLDLSKNAISDISSLATLTELTWLRLSDNRIVDISALDDLARLELLALRNNAIKDVSALAGMSELKSLSLSNNEIVDVSPLSGLTRLGYLSLEGNAVTNVSPLGRLTNLATLDLRDNRIANASPLVRLTWLRNLYLADNLVVDLSPMSELALYRLAELDLRRNPLSDTSIDVHIPAISKRGVSVAFHDAHGDTSETATEISLGGVAPGELNPTYDKDYFRLEMSEARDVAIFSTGDFNTVGRLLGGAGKELALNQDDGARANFLIRRALEPGTYYVEVRVDEDAQVRERSIGEYAINVTEDVAVDVPDSRLRASLEQALRKPPGAVITSVEIAQLEYLRASDARIGDLSGLEFAINLDLLILHDNSIADIAPVADLPRLKLLDLRRNPLNSESLNTHVPALRNRGVGVVLHDNHGDAPDTATLLRLGGRARGIVNPSYDKDYFWLEIGFRTKVTVYTTSRFDTFGRLLDEMGRELAVSEDNGDDQNFRIERILEPGAYYVEVSSRSRGRDSVGPYLVHANATPVTPPPSIFAEIDENVLTVGWGVTPGAGVTGYRVVATPVGGGESLTCEVPAEQTRCVFEGVPADAVYNVTVQAIGSGGDGPVAMIVSEQAEISRTMWRGWRLEILNQAAETAEPEEVAAPAAANE